MNFRLLPLLASLAFLLSCDVQKQLSALANMAKCEYRIANLANISLAGVDITGKSSVSQLNLTDAARLATAYATNNMPLNMTLNLDVKNPNSGPAALTRMAYKFKLDNQEMTTGNLNSGFSVGGNSTGTLPIGLSFDVRKLLSGKSKDAILNLLLNMAGQSSNPTMVGMSIKPSFNVAGQVVNFPSYFDVNTSFKAGNL